MTTNNKTTETSKPLPETEYELGSRTLTTKEVNHIQTLLLPDIQKDPNSLSYTLGKLFKEEDIHIDFAIQMSEKLGLNPKIIHSIYHDLLTPEEKEKIRTLNEILQTNHTNETQARKIQAEILKSIRAPKHYGMVIASMGSDIVAGADPRAKELFFETLKVQNENDLGRKISVVGCYPLKVIVYDSPLSEEDLKYEILWDSHTLTRPRKCGPCLIDDQINYLKSNGLVKSKRYVDDVLPSIIQEFIKQGIADVRTEVETPGYFYDTKNHKIVIVKQDISEPSQKELQDAFEILNDLKSWFGGQEDKLATCIKWGLLAPFSFAMKQIGGEFLPHLYLYGKARSGKTTMADIILYLHGGPNEKNEISGTGFNTEYRIGEKVSQSTMPLVVNEPGLIFRKENLIDMLKNMIDKLSSRGRNRNNRYVTIGAYSPVIYTSNTFLPDNQALVRRLERLSYNQSEKKGEDDIKLFESEFHMRNTRTCKLHKLNALSRFIANEVVANPDTLETNDWKETMNTLLNSACSDAGIKYPEWLKQYAKSETLDDLEDEQIEEIRMFFVDKMNYAFGKIEVYDENYHRVDQKIVSDISSSSDFHSKVWDVVNNRLVPWILPYVNKDGEEYIVITVGFKKDLHQHTEVCQTVKSIAELLNWQYKSVRMDQGNFVKGIKVSVKKFVGFCYPGMEENEEL